MTDEFKDAAETLAKVTPQPSSQPAVAVPTTVATVAQPVKPDVVVESGHLGWPDVSALLIVIGTVFAIVERLRTWRRQDMEDERAARHGHQDPQREIVQEMLKAIKEDLMDEIEKLKKEMAEARQDRKEEIAKLEKELDRLLDMVIQLIRDNSSAL